MGGDEIIKSLKQIIELIDNDSHVMAKQQINYLIDDIYMYKNNVL